MYTSSPESATLTSIAPAPQHPNHQETTTNFGRMPVAFIPHGGGPWPFVEFPGIKAHEISDLRAYLQSIPYLPPSKPRAILVISAHWEEPVPTLMTHSQPPLYFDYYGFPPASYQLTWPAPGAPDLASKVQALLHNAGFKTATHPTRGFDHGTFVPLKVAWPNPVIPVLQLSLIQGLDPQIHLTLGKTLQPLRDEGIFILGSGMSFHNLQIFFDPRAAQVAETFDAWLQDAVTRPAEERDALLTRWSSAPSARAAHPREEHLLPLMVVAGAAGTDVGRVAWSGKFMQQLSAYHFGCP